MTDTLGPYRLGPGDTESWGVVIGDAKELCREIPDESVDLIFTDPVYQNIEDYEWLAKMAGRVLKPNSACLAFAGIGYLPETHQALLAGGLSYRWRLIVRPVWSKEFHGRLCVMTQECLWYEKGHSKLYQSQFDFQYSTRKGNYSKDNANWGKGIDCLMRWINSFTKSGAVVLDPFCGSGCTLAAAKMLNRRWLAFEIDPEIANVARRRIRETKIPLPGLMITQTEMKL